MITLHNGDCLEYMRTLEANSVDAVVTDPPAGISFMGKEWDNPNKVGRNGAGIGQAGKDADYDRYGKGAMPYGYSGSSAKRNVADRQKFVAWMTEISAECLRVLKPGGYALVWALPRTSHWTATAWENGGFECRDRIAYCFGSGFPKSLDVSKALDKLADKEREVIGEKPRVGGGRATHNQHEGYQRPWMDEPGAKDKIWQITAPATDAAREWAGWGTALKPAIEDWWVFRKPLSEATVAANVLRWGCGAMNVDGCRIETNGNGDDDHRASAWSNHAKGKTFHGESYQDMRGVQVPQGRWPAHLILDGSPEVEAMFPQTTSGILKAGTKRTQGGGYHGNFPEIATHYDTGGDTGSAARFFKVCPIDEDDYPPLFYCAKAGRSERNEGLEDLPKRERTTQGRDIVTSIDRRDGKGRVPVNGRIQPAQNYHPTIKPLSLMRYLITLVSREGATVLDPFLGSGSTCVAAVQLGRNFIGCEMDAEYFAIAQARIEHAERQVAEAICQDLLFAPRVEQLVEQ
jgi:site-specific DNA-methyltransferase (adenine-specific)